MTKNYLKETAKEYIEKYTERLKKFMNEFEADESDFVNKEIEYFCYTLQDVKNSESSHDGYSTTGIDNFLIAYDLCNEIGWEKFMYSTEKKIKFLESKKPVPPQTIVKQKPELKIDQIALKYAYEGLQITRKNGNEIAKEYGHSSGEKLFQRFTYFSSPANRKGKPNLCTPKKLDNKIKLIESIIELLPIDKQKRAKDEVSILKKIYEAEYQ